MAKRWIAFIMMLAMLAATSLAAGAADTPQSPPASSEAETPAPDAEGTLSFQNLEARARAGNYSLLASAETIASIEAMDRKTAYDDLLAANNALADVTFYYYQTGNPALAKQYQAQQDALLAQLETLKPEEYEISYRENIRQINQIIDQIIIGTEALYVTILDLEQSLVQGNRSLAALGRSVTELELRYQLGQVSELSLLSLKKTYSSTESQLASLSMQIKNLKSQLQTMIGETPTGQLSLLPMPDVADALLAELDYEAGLASGMSESLDLYWKNKAVTDAKEEWDDASYGYPKKMAEHTHQSKVYSYEAAKQSFMLSYGNLYRAVFDEQQILAAAQTALSYEQKNHQAMQKKYELGMISEYTWKDAQDTLVSAEDAVTTANNNLYTAYHSYIWATRGVIAG